MSKSIKLVFSPVGGTGAGLAQSADGHTLLADRPAGKASGSGLGFNGGELLAASLGGCFWNDLHYAAESASASDFRVERVDVKVDLAGEPLRVVRARIAACLSGSDRQTLARIFEAARSGSTIANSLSPAFPIDFEHVTG
ncbi:OsmC family protein [Paracoccus sp. TK19116]|uniref:OsmC family protein n=1 Tax=Paracoccus albicereus TaxID=2922394 RepID=A0ABT1MV42_9RHOB|nr:OsmC family protein [Paracoccus albicereus]MCQ0972071.1 OsmC family protein [Paracoccus albicereus]